jgi:hypothetical protein
MSNQDGGQAFPSSAEKNVNGQFIKNEQSGMSLRDYFAAKALQGMLASETDVVQYGFQAAERAYGFADAMVAERSKTDAR